MNNSFFVVQANAVSGESAELNRWYNEQHLDDCLACDTAISAQRFEKVPGSGPGDYAYLALYEVGDSQTFAEDRRTKEGTPWLPRTAALALPAHAFFYRPLAGQRGLLARQERCSFYIEFLEAGSGDDAVCLFLNRQNALDATDGIEATELLLVDPYQERQGWHADGLLFAEVLGLAEDSLRLPVSPQPSGAALRVAESGLYRPISTRRLSANPLVKRH